MSEYTILEKLGEGGMGQVYRAHQTRLDRQVALKTLAADQASDEGLRQRFKREARLLCRLSHPHIVPVFDSGYLAGRPYIVMELIEGPSLAEILALEQPLAHDRVLYWFRQLVEALAYLHDRGIVHRDIKPRNLIVTRREGREHLVVVDFGLAKTAASRPLTVAGEVVGTLSYLAPEVIETAGGASPQDVWAAALTIVEAFTGRSLFHGTQPARVAVQVLDFDPASLEELLPEELHDWVKDLLIACLAHDPAARPGARDIGQALDERGVGGVMTTAAYLAAAQAGPALSAPDAGPPARAVPRPSSHGPGPARPHRLRAAGGLAAGMLAALVILRVLSSPPRPVIQVTPAATPSAASLAPSPAAPRPLVRDIAVFTSERSALVDFDFPPGQELTVSLIPRGAEGRRATRTRPAALRWFHQIFGDLQADRAYDLEVRIPGGAALLEAYPVRTASREVRALREASVRSLERPLYAEAAIMALEEFSDPEVLAPLVPQASRPDLVGDPLRDLMMIARRFREPALLEPVIERAGPGWGDEGDRHVLLQAAVAARCASADAVASHWFATMRDSIVVARMTTRLWGLQGRREMAEKIQQRMETLRDWITVPDLEALVACDREAARWAFHRWLEGPTPAGDLSLAALRGLIAIGDAPARSLLRAMLDPTRPSPLSNDAAVLVADGPEGADREGLVRWVDRGRPDAKALWAAARAGYWPAALPAEVTEKEALFAWSAARALSRPPLHREILAEIAGLPRGDARARELAAWRLHAWRSSDAAPALEKIVLEGGEEAPILAWCRSGLPGAAPSSAFVDHCLAQAGDPAVPVFRRMGYLAALQRAAPDRAEGPCRVIARTKETPLALQELAVMLGPDRARGRPSTRTSTFLMLGPYQKVGIRLSRGEALEARGWGVVEGGSPAAGVDYLTQDEGPLPPGPTLELALRAGRSEWPLVREWRTWLATEDTELLLATTRRQHPDREVLSGGPLRGLAVLEVRIAEGRTSGPGP